MFPKWLNYSACAIALAGAFVMLGKAIWAFATSRKKEAAQPEDTTIYVVSNENNHKPDNDKSA